MNKTYRKAIWRNIKHSKGRFLSIFLIIILGAAMFSGLGNAPETMRQTAHAYLKKYGMSDVSFIATLGFDAEDITALQKIKGVASVQPGYQFDALYEEEKANYGVTVYSSEDLDKGLNRPELIKGHLAKKADECVIDEKLSDRHLTVGKSLTLMNDNGKKKYKIVGIVRDTRFISLMERGTNTLGDGTNKGFIEMTNKGAKALALNKDVIKLRDNESLYTALNIKIKKSVSSDIFSDSYKERVETVQSRCQSVLNDRASDLYDSLTGKISTQVEQAEKELKESKDSYDQENKQFKTRIASAKKQLLEAKIKLYGSKKTYYQNKAKMNQGNSDYAKSLTTLAASIAALRNSLNQYVEKSTAKDLQGASGELATINKQLVIIEKYIDATETLLNSSATLDAAALKLAEAETELDTQESRLALSEINGDERLDAAKEQLDQADDALTEAKKKKDQVPSGTIYSFVAEDNIGIASFAANVDAIVAIAAIFPLIFFLVAALVTLTAMTRLIDSQREYCGTLRALGYSKDLIIAQYLIYALLATMPSAVIGMIFGNQFFPRIVLYLYKLMMFPLGETVLSQSVMIGMETIFISAILTSLITLFVCLKNLNAMPSTLMRPLAPKAGKRVLLEKAGFIWKRLSFNQKVTTRNIFRYKARFLMSIIGIAGCTALIITGFGIKDSVAEIVDKQYGEVLAYDGVIHFAQNYSYKQSKELKAKMRSLKEVKNIAFVSTSYMHMLGNGEDLDTQMCVYTSADDLQDFTSFVNRDGKKISLNDDGVVITQKASELLNVQSGDQLTIEINDKKYDVTINDVMKNYYGHTMYIDKTLYQRLVNNDVELNSAYVNLTKMNSANKKSLRQYLLDKGYGSIEYREALSSQFYNQVSSLNLVIVILILFAGLLDFVVLYNLTHINIEERKREIATIKVLGFRKKEYYQYIFNENLVLSVLGSVLGFGLGVLLHGFIIHTVEFDQTVFIRHVHAYVLLISFMMTMAFTLLIDRTMRKTLRDINMVESLKSVE